MAKDKKIKVPKQIAGVKVPKKVRKAGNKALALADHPAALELAAAALSAAAIALQSKGRKRRVEDAAPRLAEMAREQDGAEAMGDATARLGDLVKAAALEGARRLLDNVAAPQAAAAEQAPSRPRRAKGRKASGGRAAAADG